eukprot:3600662-Rhodomonas_salina.2
MPVLTWRVLRTGVEQGERRYEHTLANHASGHGCVSSLPKALTSPPGRRTVESSARSLSTASVENVRQKTRGSSISVDQRKLLLQSVLQRLRGSLVP